MIQEGPIAEEEFGGGHGIAALGLDFEYFQAALAAGDEEAAVDERRGARGGFYGLGAGAGAENLEQAAGGDGAGAGPGRWAR